MWQANWVAEQLQMLGCEVELIKIRTTGDVSTQSLSEVGGQGLFTKEIQRELLAKRVDLAVHSLKDLPTVDVDGLSLVAVPERESTADCLISRDQVGFEELSSGARVGTGSSRRGAQLSAWRGDISISDIRGNVDSRLRKLDEGQYDAIVLAAAGLTRLNLMHLVAEELPVDRVLPAIGQGALGLECRSEDEATRVAVQQLDHLETHACVKAERSLLRSLLAGCLAPVAAHTEVVGEGELKLRGRVLSPDGREIIEDEIQGSMENAVAIGQEKAEGLKSRGAARLIELLRA